MCIVVITRRFHPDDAGAVWALNDIPNIGETADPSAPIPLTSADTPPSAFPDLADIRTSFQDAGGDFLVATTDGHIVATGGIKPNGPERAVVLRVRVHPATRRQGVGRALMSALEHRAATLGFTETHLDTATNQPEAIAFYRSLGYQEAGRAHEPEWMWTLVYFTKALSHP